MILIFLLIIYSCKSIRHTEHTIAPTAEIANVKGVIEYTFLFNGSDYSLGSILFKSEDKLPLVKVKELKLIDNRLANYGIIKKYEYLSRQLDKKETYLYDIYLQCDTCNLRDSKMITTNYEFHQSPSYSSNEFYLLKGNDMTKIYCVFNFSGKVNIYKNIELNNQEINPKITIGENEPTVIDFAVLNSIDTIWSLTQKQIKRNDYVKSNIDTIEFTLHY